MTPEDVKREAQDLAIQLRRKDDPCVKAGESFCEHDAADIEDWLHSLLARDRREMAERCKREAELECGDFIRKSVFYAMHTWLLSKAEEMEKP